MLRALFERLCRSGEFEPIGPDETPELPLAMRPEAFAPPMPRMRVDDDLLPRRGVGWGVPLSPPASGMPNAISVGFEDNVRAGLEAQSIVRALAERRPPNGPDGICRCCAPSATEPEPEHDVTCPYLRAVEWVEANPA